MNAAAKVRYIKELAFAPTFFFFGCPFVFFFLFLFFFLFYFFFSSFLLLFLGILVV